MHLFDERMQQTLAQHQDTYERAILNENTERFWTWFIAMWVRLYPESFTHPWQKEYNHSYYNCYKRIENWMDAFGGQQAKDDLAASYRDSSSSNESSSDCEDSSESSSASSDSLCVIASDINAAEVDYDDRHLVRRKQVARQLQLRAKTRVFAWCLAMQANGLNNVSEWERVDVDTWVEATGYRELQDDV
ncbi:uncharacterized protein EV420DRAFT_1643912 [Desarmillaria tabescens]|uniref:Uncharacterized protein n=1 Tax=Armillaria tabescens TaxID=1929756 RepID=A0AA39KEZ9_ARMTA|nr:uncharacterized protein EV420DRAFT_1643912 [Desarmillaria tabescens]KAK0457573.1 hypothetical protein EV420DRAFT_1643912 [Desarmillaria tabescens]